MSDFRREYRVTNDELHDMSVSYFHLLLRGLSHHSRFQRAWNDAPKHVHDPAERAALIARARA